MPNAKFFDDAVNLSICSKNSMMKNMIAPANSVINLITLEMVYLFNLFKIVVPFISDFLRYCNVVFAV